MTHKMDDGSLFNVSTRKETKMTETNESNDKQFKRIIALQIHNAIVLLRIKQKLENPSLPIRDYTSLHDDIMKDVL